MSKKTFNIIFTVFALLACCALIYHVKEIISPSKKTFAIISLIGSSRHVVFALINCICIYGILKRPVWFIWFLGLLTLQQWYSHGSYLIEYWRTSHHLHWISLAVIVLMPLLLYLLILEKKSNQ
jgi:hypothetical protein